MDALGIATDIYRLNRLPPPAQQPATQPVTAALQPTDVIGFAQRQALTPGVAVQAQQPSTVPGAVSLSPQEAQPPTPLAMAAPQASQAVGTSQAVVANAVQAPSYAPGSFVNTYA